MKRKTLPSFNWDVRDFIDRSTKADEIETAEQNHAWVERAARTTVQAAHKAPQFKVAGKVPDKAFDNLCL
jgi:hypothetical protein